MSCQRQFVASKHDSSVNPANLLWVPPVKIVQAEAAPTIRTASIIGILDKLASESIS
jgi:hypothetical protein